MSEPSNNPNVNFTALAWILFIYSIYSVVFSLILCGFFIAYPFLKTMAGKLILLMSIMEIISFIDTSITSFYYIVNEAPLSDDYPKFCRGLGFILSFTDIYKNFLVFLIALFCYLEICHKCNSLKYHKFAYIALTLVSLLVSSIPFMIDFDNSYTQSDKIQCWFQNEMAAMLVHYMPLVLSFILSLLSMYLSLRRFRASPNYHSNYLLKLFVFPIILFSSYLLPLIRRILQYSYVDWTPLVYVMYMFIPMHGVFNAVFYVYINKFIRERLKFIILCRSEALSFLDNELQESIVVE